MRNKENKKKILKVLGLIGLFILVFSLSYALFRITLTGKKKTRITTANFKLELLDKNNNSIEKNSNNEYEYEINIEKAVPEEDESGESNEGFIFKLKNSGNVPVKYTIYLDDVELETGEERLLDQYVKYKLIKNDNIEEPALLSTLTDRKLDTGVINNGITNEYELHIWVDYNAGIEASNKVFNTKLRVVGEQYVSKMNITPGTFADTLQQQGIVSSLTKVRNGFDSENETDGLYEYTDSEGTVTYIYRGIDVNNYVSFAGSTWRVLRIQEDGTVKLIKEDALNFPSDRVGAYYAVYTGVEYNNNFSSDDDIKYEGSNIKAYVEEWYNAEMSDYDNKIVTNAYCSDRTEDHNSVMYQIMGLDKMYGIYNRLDVEDWDGQSEPDFSSFSWTPSISCRNDDKVNVKVALITADEYTLAGGGAGEVSNYLVKEYTCWTMSPASFAGISNVFTTDNNGNIGNYHTRYDHAVRPVITLKANTTVASGNGKHDTPYVIN